MQKHSLSIIMPAYNQASGLKRAYLGALGALHGAGISDYEIFIVTNISPIGSHDGTPDIAQQLANSDFHVKAIHYNSYVGLGFKYRETLKLASKEYVVMVPGSGDCVVGKMVDVFRHIGRVSVIFTYTINPKARAFYMRFAAKTFVVLCNILFGLNLKYYNGLSVYPRGLLARVPMTSDNPAYNAEILIYLLKSGFDYIELPQEIRRPSTGPGKTFRIGSVFGSLKTLMYLFWNVQIKRVRIKNSSI